MTTKTQPLTLIQVHLLLLAWERDREVRAERDNLVRRGQEVVSYDVGHLPRTLQVVEAQQGTEARLRDDAPSRVKSRSPHQLADRPRHRDGRDVHIEGAVEAGGKSALGIVKDAHDLRSWWSAHVCNAIIKWWKPTASCVG